MKQGELCFWIRIQSFWAGMFGTRFELDGRVLTRDFFFRRVLTRRILNFAGRWRMGLLQDDS